MKTITIKPHDKAVARFEAEVQQKIQHLVRMLSLVEEVNDEQDKAMVSAAIKEGKELIRKVGAARKAITSPLQQQIKQWIAKEKDLLLPVENAIGQADKQVRAFNARVAEQQRQMLEKIAREEVAQLCEAEKTESSEEVEQVRQAHDFQRQIAQARHQTDGVRQVWTFAMEDLSQVPREYLVLDEQKVRQAIRSGERHIPGIRIYQQQQTVYR